LIFGLCCDTNPEQRPNFNFNEIVYMFREESFLDALEIKIGAFRDHQATIAPTQLQAKAPLQLAENQKVVPASVIGYFQRMAEMDNSAKVVRLGKRY
jgi:hypothetical protein